MSDRRPSEVTPIEKESTRGRVTEKGSAEGQNSDREESARPQLA